MVHAVMEGEASMAAIQERDGWWIDSCASHNFTPCASDFRGPLQPERLHVCVWRMASLCRPRGWAR